MSKKHRLNQHVRRLERKIARFERKGWSTEGMRKELAYCIGHEPRPETATGRRARDLHTHILQRLAAARDPLRPGRVAALAAKIARDLNWPPERMDTYMEQLQHIPRRRRRRPPPKRSLRPGHPQGARSEQNTPAS